MNTALLAYSTTNIGDDMQSLVMRQLWPSDLPRPHSIDRDYPEANPADLATILILNGWMTCGPYPFPEPIEDVPLSISCVGFGRQNDHVRAVNHLKDKEFVGCRDIATLRFLLDQGIKQAEFVGCPTALYRTSRAYNPDGPIVFVDINPGIFTYSYSNNARVRWLSNWVDDRVIDNRLKKIHARLKVLESASLIITNRLHVALPMISAGRPVILTDHNTVAPYRFGALPSEVPLHSIEQLASMRLDHISLDNYIYDISTYQHNVRAYVNQIFSKLPRRDSSARL